MARLVAGARSGLPAEYSKPDVSVGADIRGRLVLSIFILLAWACSAKLRVAPTGFPPTTGAEPFTVEYPPPPAEVEEVGKDPGGHCVWVDGYWSWTARRWRWHGGQWLKPPADCYYSTPMLVYLPGTTSNLLYFWPPRWYPLAQHGGQSCEPPVPCS